MPTYVHRIEEWPATTLYNPVLLLILATTKYHCCYDYKMTYYLV